MINGLRYKVVEYNGRLEIARAEDGYHKWPAALKTGLTDLESAVNELCQRFEKMMKESGNVDASDMLWQKYNIAG